MTDTSGLVTIMPLQLAGTAAMTNLAVAAGTQGFLSMTPEKQPIEILSLVTLETRTK
jgi:hypothetical protein